MDIITACAKDLTPLFSSHCDNTCANVPLLKTEAEEKMAETKITLWFSGREVPQLVRMEMCHPLLKELRVLTRGKTGAAYGTQCSFQWTTAVKAFCLLLIEGKIACSLKDISPTLYRATSHLCGEKGSLASSLDYAISKQPNWLLDLFGVDSNGRCLARRFILRSNSNFKAAGPVAITLNSAYFTDKSIKLIVNGSELTQLPQIQALAIKFNSPQGHLQVLSTENGNVVLDKKPSMFFPTPFHSPEYVDMFREVLREELNMSLRSTNIFGKEAQRLSLSNMLEHPTFKQVACGTRAFDDLGNRGFGSALLGWDAYRNDSALRAALCESGPVRIALPAAMVGVMSILYHMKFIKNYDLSIDFRYPHTPDICKKMTEYSLDGSTDISCLSIASSASYITSKTKCHWVPLILGPKTSHSLVTSTAVTQRNRTVSQLKRIAFMEDPSSTTFFYFQDLMRAGVLDSKKLSIIDLEPNEIALALRNDTSELSAILWFPFDRFNVMFNSCEMLNQRNDVQCWKETVVFSTDEFAKNTTKAAAFKLAFRDSWLDLLEYPDSLAKVSELMTSDPSYLGTLIRCGGGSHFSASTETNFAPRLSIKESQVSTAVV